MTTQDPVREALTIAIEALDSIALAGMSGTGQESEEAMQAWHARRAWEFIRIAARAKDDVRAALTKPDAGEVELSREGLIDDIMDRVQLFGDAMARRIANSSPGAPGAAWQAAYNEAKRLKDEIRCQLYASPAPLAAGGVWQPIETAPKDQNVLLSDGFAVGEGFWHDGSECYGHRGSEGWFWECDRGDLLIASNALATHWMPLPAAPSPAQKEEKL